MSVVFDMKKKSKQIKSYDFLGTEPSFRSTFSIPFFYQKIILFVGSEGFHKIARCVINSSIHTRNSF